MSRLLMCAVVPGGVLSLSVLAQQRAADGVTLNDEGLARNPPGLVDARFVEALRVWYFAKTRK